LACQKHERAAQARFKYVIPVFGSQRRLWKITK